MAIDDDQPDVQPVYSSDDDDAPEEVGKEVAKTAALKQLEREQIAASAASEAIKAKRRLEIERNTEQQKTKREKKKALELSTIPYDLLAKVAAKRRHRTGGDGASSGDSDVEEANPAAPLPAPVMPPNRRTTFTRTQQTASTTFTAINPHTELNSVLAKGRKDPTSCFNFKDRLLFDKFRLKRNHTLRLTANEEKRRALQR